LRSSLKCALASKQRRGVYFYYNRAAIGLACTKATSMRIGIAPHSVPAKTTLTASPTSPTFTFLHTHTIAISPNTHLDVSLLYG
jgi:hypothetical protein